MLAAICTGCAEAATFSIDNVRVHEHAQDSGDGIMVSSAGLSTNKRANIYIPQVEVDVRVSQDAQSQNLVAKLYLYNENGELMQALNRPAQAQHFVGDGVGAKAYAYVWPTLVPANVEQAIFFPLPKNLPEKWSLVVVFGNANGVVATALPLGQEQVLDYPEKSLAEKTLVTPEVALTDAAGEAPLIEQKVESDNPRYPAFTLLMHLPPGVTNPQDVSGVLATCMIADSVGQIRDRLNAIKPQGDPNPYFAFAESHRLAIIAWGARWVWNSYANFDELDSNQIHAWDDNFQQLADAWDRGVGLLVQNYGIPDHDYLMYGLCAGGEWVHRLALHKPERFLAVQMHISTSYDAPTPEANRVMWLLTTGERDSGYDRARRFYAAAQAMHYPVIFKAVIGLGHSDSPLADRLGIRFFEYALAEKARRDAENAGDIAASQLPGAPTFEDAPFYGDLMNQDMVAAKDKSMVPRDFMVPLPSKEIAEAWNK